jgi:hypothetical protein
MPYCPLALAFGFAFLSGHAAVAEPKGKANRKAAVIATVVLIFFTPFVLN